MLDEMGQSRIRLGATTRGDDADETARKKQQGRRLGHLSFYPQRQAAATVVRAPLVIAEMRDAAVTIEAHVGIAHRRAQNPMLS